MDYILQKSGNDRVRYIEYLIRRLTEFRNAGASFGQKSVGNISIHATRRIIKSQVGFELDDESRFAELCDYIKGKIDQTILGKRNRAQGRHSFHSFEEHGHKKLSPENLNTCDESDWISSVTPQPLDDHVITAGARAISTTPNEFFRTNDDKPDEITSNLPIMPPEPAGEISDLGCEGRSSSPDFDLKETEVFMQHPQESCGDSQEETGAVSLPSESAAKIGSSWRNTLAAYQRLQTDDPQITLPQAAARLSTPVPTLWRIVNVYSKRGSVQAEFSKCGRKPPVLPTDDEVKCVREIYIKLDESRARGRGLGSSKITAFRLAAKSEDARITETFRTVVLQRRRKDLPPSWLRFLDTPASVIDAHRDARSTMAHYVKTPRGRHYVNQAGEEVPMRAGTILESDDGTLNFYATIPWPFGGDKCSDKFGVRLGRWQLLPVVDTRWEFCPAFDIVSRDRGSYRGEDSAAILGRTMLEVIQPEMFRLERGSWESKIVRNALDLCGVPVQNAWHSKQKSAVERFFDRLWTPASLIQGHVGRDRGRVKKITDLALACQDGRHDPRKDFLTLTDATQCVIGAVQFVNSEPIVSKSAGWGTWTPQERFEAQLKEQAPRRLDESMRIFFAREQREWTVRGNLVGGNVAGPLIKFPIYFQTEEFWEFEGCRVRAYFDPYTEEVRGTIVLLTEFRGYKAGHIIARDVPALELPPQVVMAADGWAGSEEQAKQLAIRKALSKAVRTEMWNYLGGRRTEARDGFGNSARIESGVPSVATRAPAPTTAAPPQRSRSPFAIPAPTAEQVVSRREKLSRQADRANQLRDMQSV